MTDKRLTVDEVRDLLCDACEDAGSEAAWARDNKISRPHVNRVIGGHAEPGPKVLRALGLVRIVRYELRR